MAGRTEELQRRVCAAEGPETTGARRVCAAGGVRMTHDTLPGWGMPCEHRALSPWSRSPASHARAASRRGAGVMPAELRSTARPSLSRMNQPIRSRPARSRPRVAIIQPLIVSPKGKIGYRGLTFTDPFGLCPKDMGGDGATQSLLDCPPGSKGYYSAMGVVREARFGPQDLVVAGMSGPVTRLGFDLIGQAASRAGVTILEREGAHIVGSFTSARGEAQFITEVVRSGEDLILRGTHIEGAATLREAEAVARSFGQEMGASRVIIEGGRRSTGLRVGEIPRKIILDLPK